MDMLLASGPLQYKNDVYRIYSLKNVAPVIAVTIIYTVIVSLSKNDICIKI